MNCQSLDFCYQIAFLKRFQSFLTPSGNPNNAYLLAKHYQLIMMGKKKKQQQHQQWGDKRNSSWIFWFRAQLKAVSQDLLIFAVCFFFCELSLPAGPLPTVLWGRGGLLYCSVTIHSTVFTLSHLLQMLSSLGICLVVVSVYGIFTENRSKVCTVRLAGLSLALSWFLCLEGLFPSWWKLNIQLHFLLVKKKKTTKNTELTVF